jgi:hypothetical protein
LRPANDPCTWGTTHRIVCGVVWTVVGRASSYIVRRAVWDVTYRSPSPVVSQAIRSGARQATARVMGRATRPAIRPVTPQVTETAIPQVICETTRPVVPHITTGVLSKIASVVAPNVNLRCRIVDWSPHCRTGAAAASTPTNWGGCGTVFVMEPARTRVVPKPSPGNALFSASPSVCQEAGLLPRGVSPARRTCREPLALHRAP